MKSVVPGIVGCADGLMSGHQNLGVQSVDQGERFIQRRGIGRDAKM